MDRPFFAPRTTQEILASLEIETQQNLVDSLYDDDHPYKLKQYVSWYSFNLDLFAITYRHQGQRVVRVTVKDIVELRPPSLYVAHRIDVRNPPFFPVRLCYWHGKQYLVHTDEELKQQPAGAAPTPLGPWPAGFGDPWLWKWDPGKGPYAPAPYRGQYDSYAPGGTNAVWATQSLIYYRQAIPKGAIFLLEGGSEDRRLDREGSIQAVESWAQHTVPHDPTGWWFIDKPHLEEQQPRYKTADLTGFEQFMLQPPELTPTPKLEDTPQPDTTSRVQPGRPRRFFSAQNLHDELVTVGKTLTQDSRYRQEDYADAMAISVETLRSHLTHWRKEDPAGLLGWERIVDDTKA